MKTWLYGAACLALAAAACTTSTTAQQPGVAAPQSISARDKAEGAKAHPQLLEEFGGLYEGPQSAYVTRVGRGVAAQSGLAAAPNEFTISLLNSPVNNAFAIPGGYVYVTRQLMVLMNNEAELASVLGHEVGHIAARHSQKRNAKASRAGLGAILATVLGGVLLGDNGARLGQQLGSALAQRYVLSYSRAQEYEADDLGITYLARSGYEPLAASTMLASLASQTALDARRDGRNDKALPEWASTHPDPASRVVRARQKASQMVPQGRQTNREAFLQMLDGIIYDDDPQQGIVEGRSFQHPGLRLAFTAPPGYVMSNGSKAVSINGAGGQAQFSAGPYQGDLDAYLGRVFRSVGGQTQLAYSAPRRTVVNGLPTSYAIARANTSSGPVDVTVFAYEFGPTQAYHLVAITRAGAAPFEGLFQSVRRLSAEEAGNIRPRRIAITTVKAGDTVASLATKMAYTDYQIERFRVLNGLAEAEGLRPGQKVKLVTFAASSK
jgi:predicted Zn-dependent protease